LELTLEIQHMARAGVAIELGHSRIAGSASILQVVHFLWTQAANRAVQLRHIGLWRRLERLVGRRSVLAVIGRLRREPIMQRRD